MGREFVAHMMARMRVFMTVTTISGAVAVLAGIALYAAIWAGTGFMGPARWYATGGHFATLAIVFAAIALRPA